jgi:starvation-inducible DNA-binding protein
VGHNFIAIHEMLDPQAAAAHKMVDTTAERIAALGGTPIGTPATVAARRNGDGYSLGRAPVYDHLIALDQHFATVIEGHRSAQVELAELDPVSEDMVIEQLRALEHFQWLIRAHLEIG